MSRKRAIEAAMARLHAGGEVEVVKGFDGAMDTRTVFDPLEVWEEMEGIWEEARIAGLREAGRRCFYDSDRENIQAHARELAKEARGK